MPAIRKSADLRNKYREPIFITKNGKGDLAVMSIETYEELVGRIELYHALQMGLDQINNGEIIPGSEMMKKIKKYAGK